MKEIVVEKRAATAWVTFDRPEARNAFTYEMYTGLRETCGALAVDDGIRVVVFQGRGEEAFVSGSDIGTFRDFHTLEQALAYEAHVEAGIAALERLPKPTIALVRGVATGGGAVLALACDLRIAADNARFGVPVARTLGNCLSIRNVARLVESLGPALAKELVFTARLVDAGEAGRRGVFDEVVPLERAEARAGEVADAIAANAPLTLRATKLALLRTLEARRASAGRGEDLVELTYTSADFREGVAAFLEKRTPVWRGR